MALPVDDLGGQVVRGAHERVPSAAERGGLREVGVWILISRKEQRLHEHKQHGEKSRLLADRDVSCVQHDLCAFISFLRNEKVLKAKQSGKCAQHNL